MEAEAELLLIDRIFRDDKLTLSKSYWSPKPVILNQTGKVPRFNDVKYSYNGVTNHRHSNKVKTPVENDGKVRNVPNIKRDSNWKPDAPPNTAFACDAFDSRLKYVRSPSTSFKTRVLKQRERRRMFEFSPTGESYEISRLSPSGSHDRRGKTYKVHTGKETASGVTRQLDDGQHAPFQPQSFMSSAMMKRTHLPIRHHDNLGATDYAMATLRGSLLHTPKHTADRAPLPYQESMGQRDRLQLEHDYLEKLRYVKLRREMWPHRAEIDFTMAGKRMEFDERFDLNRELIKLKALVLPEAARDLLHGKGVSLPANHGSIKPRPSLRELSNEFKSEAGFLPKHDEMTRRPEKSLPTLVNDSRVTSLPAINNNFLDIKHRPTIAKARHHTKSLRTLLSL